MPYFLKHHFDPDFNHLDIKSKVGANDRVDHLNRDYVQNVVVGEILAEWVKVPESETEAYDSRFLYPVKSFPMGPNCVVDAQNPDQLLAAVNGYVYYDAEQKIAVKTLLNIRRDVDYVTGNVSFVGDVVVHGAVRSGFSVKARNLLVKGPVEGATLEASGSMQIHAGVRGDNQAVLRAKDSVKVKFCENAQVSAGKNLLVEGSVMHCKLYVGNALAVKEKLIGGETTCRRLVHVGEQLGGGLSTITSIVLGYDPALLQKIAELKARLEGLRQEKARLAVHVVRNTPSAVQRDTDIAAKISVFEKQLAAWSEKLTSENFDSCAVVAPGEVRPGVEVSIGPFFHANSDFLKDIRFSCKNNQIAANSPAEPRK